MKILFVHPYMEPRVESVSMHIKAISKYTNHEKYWLSFERKISPIQKINHINIPCAEFNIPFLTPPPVKIIYPKLKKVMETINNHNFDIVHLQFHYFWDLNFLMKKILKNQNSKFVITFHHPFEIEHLGIMNKLTDLYFKITLKDLIRLSDGTAFVSNYTKKTFFDRYKYNKPTNVVYNGVHTDVFKPSKKENNFSKLKPYVLCVGRMTKLKNQEALVKAFAIARNKELNLVFVGGWSHYRNQVKKVVRKLGVEKNVFFFENLHEKELIKAFQSCSFYASTSLSEGFGIVFAEAMACEKACVGYNVEAIPEVIGNAGILINKNDINNFSESIKYLADNESEARKIGKKARKRVLNNFTWKHVAKNTEKLYKSVL